jgi:hypothetical protein
MDDVTNTETFLLRGKKAHYEKLFILCTYSTIINNKYAYILQQHDLKNIRGGGGALWFYSTLPNKVQLSNVQTCLFIK